MKTYQFLLITGIALFSFSTSFSMTNADTDSEEAVDRNNSPPSSSNPHVAMLASWEEEILSYLSHIENLDSHIRDLNSNASIDVESRRRLSSYLQDRYFFQSQLANLCSAQWSLRNMLQADSSSTETPDVPHH